jgi:3-hydroxybutyryl-CoA dehydrogenase
VRVEQIGIVGAGQMGIGIAEVCAAGAGVVVMDSSEAALEKGQDRLRQSLIRGVRSGRLTAEQATTYGERVRFTSDLELLFGSEIVIEAVVESLEVKTALFASLDELLDEARVLASNTSSLPIAALARVTARPERVLGLHFFNPPTRLDLIEMTTTLRTSDEAQATVRSFFEHDLGRTVIRSGDRPGFVVNALLVPYLLAAVRMLESGFATKEDIDMGMLRGCGHPMGPLRLIDLIGLDTVVKVADGLYTELKDPACLAPVLLRRMVDACLHGQKSGAGFYEYDERS